MSCPGLHCPGCGGGGGVIAPLAAIGIGAAVLEIVLDLLWLIIAATISCAVLSVAAVVVLSRLTARREAAYAASPRHQALIGAAPPVAASVTATVIPQVSQGTGPRAIEQHVIVHHVWDDPPDFDAARIIRSAILPGDAGEIITEER
jgi:hypothetical protein